MKKDSSALNLFYCQGLKDIIEENKEDLKRNRYFCKKVMDIWLLTRIS